MNWGLVGWFAGIVLTFVGLKFVIVAAKTLFSKETMQAAINVVGDGASRTTKKFEKYLKNRTKKVKAYQAAKRSAENKPIVTIR